MRVQNGEKPKVLLLQSMSEIQNNFVPLGLAYIGAVFEQEGCEVKIVDASAPYAEYSMEGLVKEIRDFKPHLIGFSLTVTFVKYSYELITRISKNSQALIVAGGPHATILPYEPLEHGADIVVRGEGERTAKDLARYLKGELELGRIPGISYVNEKQEVVDNPSRELIVDLDSIPLPAKHLFRKDDFVRSQKDLIRFSNIMTGRGCPGECTYCSNKLVWGRHVRWRSADSILEEIRFLNKQYGLERFHFLDDSFTSVRKKVYNFCKGLRKEFPQVKWSCITRVDLVDKELLQEMARAGCVHINYGLESGDPYTLKKVKKKITPEQAEKAIRWTKESGITAGVNFMHGFPWDTVKSMRRTRNFIREISPFVRDIMPGGILVPYPGTEIYEEYKGRFGFGEWWLKQEVPDVSELKVSPPLFRKIFFDFDMLDCDYFGYPRKIKKEIEKTAVYIGRHNLLFFAEQVSPPPFHYISLYIVREALYLLVLTSRFLFRINPSLERALMNPFLKMASRREAKIRSNEQE